MDCSSSTGERWRTRIWTIDNEDMRFFRRKKKDKRKKEPKHIRVIRLMLWRLFKKIRLREQVEKANAWAANHLQRTITFTIVTLSLSLAIGVVLTVTEDENPADPSFDEIASVTPMFEGMRRIQANKAYQMAQMEDLTFRGNDLKHELDSLIRIPNKSHDDSVQIVIKVKQLEIIVDNLERYQ